eukprot:4195988-Prymnesium_polylepis.1
MHPQRTLGNIENVIQKAICTMDKCITGHLDAKREVLKLICQANSTGGFCASNYSLGFEGPPGTGIVNNSFIYEFQSSVFKVLHQSLQYIVKTIKGMNPPKTNSIENAFRPAFEEISRRSGVAQSFAETDTSYFPRSTDPVNTPFRIPNQQVVLVSMGTSVLAPRPEDASRPALRVYGAFPTREDATDHAQIINSLDDSCSLVIVKQGEWILFPQNEHVRDDLEANKSTYIGDEKKEGEAIRSEYLRGVFHLARIKHSFVVYYTTRPGKKCCDRLGGEMIDLSQSHSIQRDMMKRAMYDTLKNPYREYPILGVDPKK